ncbi:hypothetical protein OV203_35040 [Nannocystis sp. ILAH1]|uniref:hypothetical protein n=1 Tax=unclassified Nannocystis TaxID=2627009 RepID=UPI00227083C9|nr:MULTISPECIES: hypothetical protein [unclassified Nannocystis]MCY0992408.1 hypothetical protein [Nannocystis sp. ILAH1]MCY1069004.1 hypothetical protein [Nannocystis sp. RBIL2]
MRTAVVVARARDRAGDRVEFAAQEACEDHFAVRCKQAVMRTIGADAEKFAGSAAMLAIHGGGRRTHRRWA